ncbi:MAG: xanthine dehydrogenase family protein subunit M [Acidimicrobiales bacterium]
MKPAQFEYHAPSSVEEAVRLLGDLDADGEVRILAGGQSLFPMLALRLAQPDHVVDLNRLNPALSGIERVNGSLRIAAMTRQRAAERSDVVATDCPLLAEALPQWGHPQIRNRGTLGGSLVHADPAAEFPAIALALDATMHLAGPNGERSVAAADFFQGFLTTDVRTGEILTHVDLPVPAERSGTSFQELSRRHGDFAMVGVGASVTLDGDHLADVRIAFSGVASTPVRATSAEHALNGVSPSEDAIAAAASAAAAELDPPSDVHASSAYRRHVAGVLARRALGTAIERARN